MEAKIGITAENLSAIAYSLSKILADEYVLYTKTRKAHWNVEGPDFYGKHKFFEIQIAQLDEIIDDLAERIRTLGHYPPASLQEFLNLTQLTEEYRGANDSSGYIKLLLSDHEGILAHLRGNINSYIAYFNDAGSSDYITGLMEKHEKMAWMLRAHLG